MTGGLSATGSDQRAERVEKDGADKGSLRDVLWSIGGSMFLTILSFPIAYINAWILGPNLLGALKLIETLIGYANHSDLGLTKAYQRETPILAGANSTQGIARIRNLVFTMSLLSTIAVAVAALLAYLAGWRMSGAIEGVGTMLVALTLLLVDRVGSFCGRYMSAEGYFVRQNQARMITGILHPVFVVPLVVMYQLEGALVAGILTTLIYTGIVVRSTGLRVAILVDWGETRRLLRTGLSLFWLSFNNKVFWSVEIMMLPIFLGMYEVGIFAFAIGAIRIARTLPQSLNSILFRNVALDRGRAMGTGGVEYLREFVNSNLPGYSVLTAWSLGFISFLFLPVTDYFLKEYSQSFELIVIMAAGMMFFPLHLIFSYTLNMQDKFNELIAINVAVIVINILLDWFLIDRFGVVGAAIGAAVSMVIAGTAYAVANVFYVYDSSRLGTCGVILAKTVIPAAACTVGIVFLTSLLGSWEGSFFTTGTFEYMVRFGFLVVVYTLLCVGVYSLVFAKERLAMQLWRFTVGIFATLKNELKNRKKVPAPA